jgi:polyphosphate kinase
MNNLVDPVLIDKLYKASQAGVKVELIIRSVCCLIPGKKNLSENIQAKSIIDAYLEHSRIYIFANGGRTKCYISSSDWMIRNLDLRYEVSTPILDRSLVNEIEMIFDTQWNDNTKSRIIDKNLQNNYFSSLAPACSAQTFLSSYYQNKIIKN